MEPFQFEPWMWAALAGAVASLFGAYNVVQWARVRDLKSDKKEDARRYEERIENYRSLLEKTDRELDECKERLINHGHNHGTDPTHAT